MPFHTCVLSQFGVAVQQNRVKKVLESIPVEHQTCLNLTGTKIKLLALLRLINISLITQRVPLARGRRNSAEKMQN